MKYIKHFEGFMDFFKSKKEAEVEKEEVKHTSKDEFAKQYHKDVKLEPFFDDPNSLGNYAKRYHSTIPDDIQSEYSDLISRLRDGSFDPDIIEVENRIDEIRELYPKIDNIVEGFMDFFKSKKEEPKSEPVSVTPTPNAEIMIDSEPYDISQFGQNKYGVYITCNNKHYYLGDIREYTKSKGPTPYMSYLDLDRVTTKTPPHHSKWTIPLVKPNREIMSIINAELDKNYLSRYLMDDTITHRKRLEKEYGIIL